MAKNEPFLTRRENPEQALTGNKHTLGIGRGYFRDL
jgi:hypothetical protein